MGNLNDVVLNTNYVCARVMLRLSAYRSIARVDQPFEPVTPAAAAERPTLLGVVLDHLRADGTASRLGVAPADLPDGADYVALRRQVRAALTVRGPDPLPETVHAALDAILRAEGIERGETRGADLPRLAGTPAALRFAAPASVALWRGDITTLAVDAIVNAGNSEMLGCFRPFHACIDNAIHSAAGPRLREDCGRIMALQGHPEPTGTAKVTRGYNLPARFVLHTVGPIVDGPLRPEHEQALANCYRACLDLAAELPEVRSMAFCAISTGVFGFPKAPAARVATRTVAGWMEAHPGALDLVLFNVFSKEDQAVYERVLEGGG